MPLLPAETGEAAAPVEDLVFLDEVRRFAVLVAEEGVPEPDATEAVERKRLRTDKNQVNRDNTCSSSLRSSLLALVGSGSDREERKHANRQ